MISALLAALIALTTGIPRTVDADLVALAETRAAETTVTYAHRDLLELDNGRWQAWSEVLAVDPGTLDPAAGLVQQWMGSPNHRAILTDPRYDAIGCAVSPSGEWLYAVCVFGDSAVTPPPPIVEPVQPAVPVVVPSDIAPLLPNTAVLEDA